MNLPIKAKLEQIRTPEYMSEFNQVLNEEEKQSVRIYFESGGQPLSPDTSAKFFELYITGTNCYDIWKINKPFPYPAILDARVKFAWDKQRDEYSIRLQSEIRNKVAQAQLEAADLMSDMLLAAKKKSSHKLKRYLQSGDEKELEGAMGIENLGAFQRIIDGLMKVTGQDKTSVIKNVTEVKQIGNPQTTTNGNLVSPANDIKTLDTESSAQILEIMANAKRKANESGNT